VPDPRPTPPRELIVDIDGLTPAGDGFGRFRTGTVTVPGTIPGERVRVRLAPGGHAPRGQPSEAELLEILQMSPHRIQPRCAHAGVCGGCSLQHISYPEQLRLKTAMVDRLLRAALPGAPTALDIVPAVAPGHPWEYRQKVHFVFGRMRGARLAIGHYARRSRTLVPVRECPVHASRGNELAFALAEVYDRAGVEPESSPRGGVLRSVAIRVGRRTSETAATVIVSSNTDKRLRTATQRWLASDEAPTALHVNVHGGSDPFIFGAETRRLAGPERLREDVAGVSFLLSPTAFFQTNVEGAEILVGLVLDAVPAGARVLDLYAGAGLFALPLARAGCRVTAVEESRAAVADGLASLRLNRLPPERCRFLARPVEEAVAAVRAADVVVLDPPRAGCSAQLLQEVFGRLHPSRAIYVSCNPEALARDLRIIVSLGYSIDTVQPVDMFPHTGHVETVVTISGTARTEVRVPDASAVRLPQPRSRDRA
jgi:23S rRNA (uracil1939-C5)-methyltransferase